MLRFTQSSHCSVTVPVTISVMADKTKKDAKETVSVGTQGRCSDIWSNFAEDTSFHACKNIVKKERCLAQRIVWALIFFGMIFGLIYGLADLLVTCLKFQTVTRSTVEYLPSMDFPTITFCNANSFNKSKMMNSEEYNDISEFLLADNSVLSHLIPYNLSMNSPWMNRSTLEMYADLSFTKEDQIILAKLEDQKIDLKMFDETLRSMGMCFRFNSEEMIQKHGVQKTKAVGPTGSLELVLNIHQDNYFPGPLSHAGMQIYINHPTHKQTHLDPSISVAPGTTTVISMTKTKYKLMPHPYKSFGSEGCLDIEDSGFRNPLKYSSAYSFGACLQECYSRVSTSNCGCKTALDPDDVALPDCTFLQYSMCNLKLYKTVYTNLTSQRELCDCKKPCTFYVYDTKLSQATFPSNAVADYMMKRNFISSTQYARENLINVLIFYDQPLLHKVEHEPEYTLSSIIGTLGGQMGFFLGASVITLYEVLETCLYSVKSLVWRRTVQKQTHISS